MLCAEPRLGWVERRRFVLTRDDATGTYRADPEAMRTAVDALSEKILRLQGDGNYDEVAAFVERYGTLDAQLQEDLDRLATAGIPVDIVYEQGMSVLEGTSK